MTTTLTEVRERAEHYGVDALPDADLAAIVLGMNPVTVGELISPDEGIRSLLSARNLTRTRASRVRAAVELGRRVLLKDRPPVRVVSVPEDLAAVFILRLAGKEREEFHVALLNARNALLDVVCVAKGTVDACALHPRDVFRAALERNATGIIIAHNHPSGNPRASASDIELTRKLREGANVLCLRLLDHFIVADRRAVSMRANGSW